MDYKQMVVKHYCPDCSLDDLGNLYIISETESGSKWRKDNGLERSSAFCRYLVINDYPDMDVMIVTKTEFHKINAKRRKGVKRTPEQRARMLQAQKLSGIKERKKWFDEIDAEIEEN
jgi:hypothetical protein